MRARAAHALGAIGARRCRARADDVRSPTPSGPCARWRRRRLGRVHDAAAIPAACAALRDREWWVRANAAEALRLAGPAGVDALEGMLAGSPTSTPSTRRA